MTTSTPHTWLQVAEKFISQDKATGLLRTKDDAGNPILLVWEKVPTQHHKHRTEG